LVTVIEIVFKPGERPIGEELCPDASADPEITSELAEAFIVATTLIVASTTVEEKLDTHPPKEGDNEPPAILSAVRRASTTVTGLA
jgi:hypothetical protein